MSLKLKAGAAAVAALVGVATVAVIKRDMRRKRVEEARRVLAEERGRSNKVLALKLGTGVLFTGYVWFKLGQWRRSRE